jgi:hypothetical protein
MTAIRLEHLWPALALGIMWFLICLTPVAPNDYWMHARIGQLTWETGQIPSTQLFGWTVPSDVPIRYGAWLAHWLFYVVHELGGVPLTIFLRNVLSLGTYALVGLEAHRRSSSWKLAALAVLLAELMTLNNVDLRPQMWAWLPFTISYVLLARYADGVLRPAWLLIIPAITAFWVNVHGSYPLAAGLFGACFLGEIVRRWLSPASAHRWKGIGWIGVVGALTFLAWFVNPFGVGILGYLRGALADAPSQTLGIEWQPPSPAGLTNGTFFLSVLLLLAAMAYTRRRPSPTDLFLVAGFLWLAWSGQRYVIWYGIVVMPILAQTLSGLSRPKETMGAVSPGGIPALNALLCVLVFLPGLLVQPWWVRDTGLASGYLTRTLPPPAPPLLSSNNPVAATEYLLAHPGGRLFNELGYGSYLIWVAPSERVFIDPRFEAYPLQLFLDYIEISEGRDWAALLDKYGANRAMVNRQLQPKLAEAMRQSSTWEIEFEDAWSQLWRRRGNTS